MGICSNTLYPSCELFMSIYVSETISTFGIVCMGIHASTSIRKWFPSSKVLSASNFVLGKRLNYWDDPLFQHLRLLLQSELTNLESLSYCIVSGETMCIYGIAKFQFYVSKNVWVICILLLYMGVFGKNICVVAGLHASCYTWSPAMATSLLSFDLLIN